MEEIQYIGENLLPGKIGHFAVVLSFVASILASAAYIIATQRRNNPLEETTWRNIGRAAFGVHGLSVFTIIASIFYIMIEKHYEYHYAYQHVSDDLPMQYIFSAFWEGQEGSFLLWMFWHVVLGAILIFTAKKWESPVLTTISLVQMFLGTMILGLYFGGEDVKIGSNPLVLLRDAVEAPIFSTPDYLAKIAGTGLNPLLQNYWMTIHPPTLFLGFASTVVPFAYAIAGLWTKDHKGWLKPVLPWALFSAAILGTGILMGGAWAYEALSFGGYWAWDPVENMSLVPWLILIGGLHTNVVARSTGYSIKSTYLFYALSFVMIVYSTFLTRSGILGDTSVHAFTEMGLEWQLIIFLAFFTLLTIVLYFLRRKGIPEPPKEEVTSAREFWMFIGALVLLFSAVLITFTTSIPVYNKIFTLLDGVVPSWNLEDLHRTSPKDPIAHYNKYQLWIAILIATLSSLAQFLRYRSTNESTLRKVGMHLGASAALALLVGGLTMSAMNVNAWQYMLLYWACLFTIFVNIDYLVTMIKGNLKLAGSIFAHLGFGLMIIGSIFSGLNKDFISKDSFMRTNPNTIEGFSEEDANNNVLLYKNLPTKMGPYIVTYQGDSSHTFNRYFNVNYKRYDKDQNIAEEFNLMPNIIYSKKAVKVESSNPSTKHYLTKDIFTHISALPNSELDPQQAKAREDSIKYKAYDLGEKDVVQLDNYLIQFMGMTRKPTNENYIAEEGDLAIGATLKISNHKTKEQRIVEPIYLFRGNQLIGVPYEITDWQLKFRISEEYPKLLAETTKALMANQKQFTVKANETFTYEGKEITFLGFNKDFENDRYAVQDGDIAVSAVLAITDPATKENYKAEPVFYLRKETQYGIEANVRPLGLQLRFIKLDPSTETATIDIASGLPKKEKLILDIAENIPRNDYIVMEAIVFPGINLFWIGSILMMLGFLVSMFKRRADNKKLA